VIEWSYSLRVVLAGSTVLGLVGGVLGSFAFLRRQSLLGDALAHAALPGVCVAFAITGSKEMPVLLAGALVAGGLGAFAILGVIRGSTVKEDSAIGIVLSVFFGLGIVLLTWIQKLPGGNQSGLDTFLFGQAATLGASEVGWMTAVAVVVCAITALLFKEFHLVAFDRGFGASLGYPVRSLEAILTALLVVVVVLGLQTVGVVLMVATLLTPAAAARQWTDRLGPMTLLSGAIGAGCGGAGAIASALIPRLPTGPAIVLLSSAILLVSLLFAPGRGLLHDRARARAVRRRIRRENLLKDLYRIGERAGRLDGAVPDAVLLGLRGRSPRRLRRDGGRLVRDGSLVREGDGFRLTDRGRADAARIVRTHRLWETYLTRRLDLPADHVHRDAEAMEHALTPEAVDELDRLLGRPETDPHGRRIPREGRA
jgi:manganese/zinc/iron transport system permease protein